MYINFHMYPVRRAFQSSPNIPEDAWNPLVQYSISDKSISIRSNNHQAGYVYIHHKHPDNFAVQRIVSDDHDFAFITFVMLNRQGTPISRHTKPPEFPVTLDVI
ncbi:hypothetical protein PPYR_00364 [Photinus pyralis]|uniref:Uncharacterized protein n=1 Tax=Photinus pyralis TaxID=7054 RepID=A0A5N4B1D4_PHOPY|nr:hypothetical protein PPYR_00364 [Photinus pyralis]